MVGVLGRDLPALALRELAADAELVSDRRVALVLGRVPGVDGDLHSRPPSTELSNSVTRCSKTSRAAWRASNRTSTSSASSAYASACPGERSTGRSTSAARAGGHKRDPFLPRMITPR